MNVRNIVAETLLEDLGPEGDITSRAVVSQEEQGVFRLAARASGVIAGTAVATEVCNEVDPDIEVMWKFHDGDRVAAGDVVGEISGSTRSILTAERTMLNFLCHLSGVATLTREFVDAAGSGTQIRDTRKTLPGLRLLEKAAVRAGGGHNHRMSLSQELLIKDNHVAGRNIAQVIETARAAYPDAPLEMECDSLEQVAQATGARPDLILLDNMKPDQVRQAIEILRGEIPVEVSGGVTLENVREYADAGADFIAIGALTHSAPALDLSLEIVTNEIR